MTYSIKLKNGQVLRGFIRTPGETVKANILFVHGLGEHINRYNEWAGLFSDAGIGFTGVDLPGHGASDGRRGHIRNFSLTDEMTGILMDHIKSTFPGIPLLLYGHSLGGVIVLDYILRKSPEINGAIVTSPWLKLAFQPGKLKLMLASVMKIIIPGLIQPSGLIPEQISQDKDIVTAYLTDNHVHDRISVSLFNGAMSAATHSLDNSHNLKVPLLLMHGKDDLITSPEGSCEFAAGTDFAELKIWEGGYHELHNEPFKHEVFQYIINWISRILS